MYLAAKSKLEELRGHIDELITNLNFLIPISLQPFV